MTTPSPSQMVADQRLALLFAPLHKRAFGMAVGLAAALMTVLLTAVPLLRGTGDPINLGLLAQYFRGYTVSWTGALIGAAWAGFVGFVMGWFLAFCRNALLAFRVLLLRARAEYGQTRDFMDHI